MTIPMRTARVHRGIAAVLLLASSVLSACDDDATSPQVASAVTVSSGNDQTVVAGGTLANPLVAVITDQNGAAMSNVTATWAITQGGGTLASASTASDTLGKAQVTYTAGSSAGTVTITATVGSLTPATFTLTVTSAGTSP